jgi:3-hydroxyisobutyrate dehydrogenase
VRIAFIGLGLMGRLMSANLAKAGHQLQTYDLNGSGNCRSPEQAAAGAKILITMVPDGKAVRKAILAALPGLARGTIVIDMSSSDPGTTRELGKVLAKRGVAMLDSPVSGAKAKAKDGTLALMVGGDPKVLKKARPVLLKMGSEIFPTGALGSGHAVKALNNYLGAVGTIAGFEALLIGDAYGLDTKVMVDAINASTGKNSTTERKIPQQVFTGAFASGFLLSLMTKDVGIAAGLAKRTKVPAPYLAATLRIWRDAERRLRPRADHTELYHYLRRLQRPLRPPSRAAASRPARSRPRPRRPS